MSSQLLCLVTLLVVTFCNATPDFCGKNECPHYKVVEKTKFYELRCYDTYNWVTTGVKDVRSTRWDFMRLFYYISGKNERKQKIPMTVPVLMKKPYSSKQQRKGAMSFFIPFETQANPPRPLDKRVNLIKMKSLCLYVRSFGGYMSRWNSLERKNKNLLVSALKRDGLQNQYDKDYYYTAGYSSPWQMRDRHNEVWFVKKDSS